MPSLLRLFTCLLAILVLSQCGAPAPPKCTRLPTSSRKPAAATLQEARTAWMILADPGRRAEWPYARQRYNTAVKVLFDQLRCPHRDWNAAAQQLGTVIAKPDRDSLDLKMVDTIFPATEVKTDDLGDRKTQSGIGVAVVGWKDQSRPGETRAPFVPPTGSPYSITALLRFDRAIPSWQFALPLRKDQIAVGGATHPLEADWSASHAFYWQMCRLDDLTIQNVILPERFQEETGLYFGQTYDPDKIPVIFVHGLKSSPATFRHMVNELAADASFRRHYQVWYFNYPTGIPWMVTAAKFRAFMRDAQKYAIAHGGTKTINRTVIVAHSMGGLITHASLSAPKNEFYDAFFKKPLDQLNCDEKGRRLIKEGLLYEPLLFPDRLVFLAVPHQGSPLADRMFAIWISDLIKLPKRLTVDLLAITVTNAANLLLPKPDALPNGINSLSPENGSIQALKKISFRPVPKLKIHSIIGDRGRNNSPNSSDGIVPYWSSHLNGVDSEKIVPSNHSVPKNSEAIEEVRRILQLHLK